MVISLEFECEELLDPFVFLSDEEEPEPPGFLEVLLDEEFDLLLLELLLELLLLDEEDEAPEVLDFLLDELVELEEFSFFSSSLTTILISFLASLPLSSLATTFTL